MNLYPTRSRPASRSSRRSRPQSRSAAALAVFASALVCALPSWADAGPDLSTQLDQLFRDAYASDPGTAPGASVLVKKGDQVLLRQGYGSADLELGVAIEPDMVFRLGSITKQFTAVAVMLLVEDGKLKLDQTLAELLPDYPDVHDGEVTLEQLLDHTSGIPSYTAMPEFWEKARQDLTVDEMLDFFDEKELEFEPGTQWAYNNSGYFLLGAVIEQISGKTYADFMQERVFKPLGLSRTTYGDPTKITPRRVEGYQFRDGEYRVAEFISMSCPYAAGSLLSTVDDLATWKDALKAASEKDGGWISKAGLESMWQPQILADGEATSYGYGWQLSTMDDRKMIHHGGGIHGFTTHALWIPEGDIFVAVLSNGHPQSPTMMSVQAAALVAGRPFERRAIEVAPEKLERFVGVYRIDEATKRVVTLEDGALWTQRSEGRKMKVTPASDTGFFYEDSLTRLRFLVEDGKVTGMALQPWDGEEELAEKTDQPIPGPKKTVQLSHEQLDRLAGRYELAPNFVLEVRREGDSLITQATGQGPIEIFASSETEFFNEQIGGRIVFDLADGASATALTLYQGGREMKAPRLAE